MLTFFKYIVTNEFNFLNGHHRIINDFRYSVHFSDGRFLLFYHHIIILLDKVLVSITCALTDSKYFHFHCLARIVYLHSTSILTHQFSSNMNILVTRALLFQLVYYIVIESTTLEKEILNEHLWATLITRHENTPKKLIMQCRYTM